MVSKICIQLLYMCIHIQSYEVYTFSVALDSNKIVSKHLLSRRQSSPSSSTNVSIINNENNKLFEFEQLLETIQLSPIFQKDTASCFNKLRYRLFLITKKIL